MRHFKWDSVFLSLFVIVFSYSKYIENKNSLGEPINFLFITFSVLLLINIISFFLKKGSGFLTKREVIDNIRAGFNKNLTIGFFFFSISLTKIFFDLQYFYQGLICLFLSFLFIVGYFYWMQKSNVENVVQKVHKSDYNFIIKNIALPIGLVLLFMQTTSFMLRESIFFYIVPLIFLVWAILGAIILFKKKQNNH